MSDPASVAEQHPPIAVMRSSPRKSVSGRESDQPHSAVGPPESTLLGSSRNSTPDPVEEVGPDELSGSDAPLLRKRLSLSSGGARKRRKRAAPSSTPDVESDEDEIDLDDSRPDHERVGMSSSLYDRILTQLQRDGSKYGLNVCCRALSYVSSE